VYAACAFAAGIVAAANSPSAEIATRQAARLKMVFIPILSLGASRSSVTPSLRRWEWVVRLCLR